MVFVLAIDYHHLGGSAKALYGTTLNFEEYFRKFCHRSIELPEPSEDQQLRLAKKCMSRYMEVAGTRMSLVPSEVDFDRRMSELAHALKMYPRQVHEAFRILGHMMQALDEDRRGNLRWGFAVASMLLSCLRVSRLELFEKLNPPDGGVIEVCDLLVDVFDADSAVWWIQVILIGSAPVSGAADFRKDYLLGKGWIKSDEEYSSFFSGFRGAWPGGAGQIPKIARMIRQAQSFS